MLLILKSRPVKNQSGKICDLYIITIQLILHINQKYRAKDMFNRNLRKCKIRKCPHYKILVFYYNFQ